MISDEVSVACGIPSGRLAFTAKEAMRSKAGSADASVVEARRTVEIETGRRTDIGIPMVED